MKDAIILLKDEEITSIEVANDSFYSDHIIPNRKDRLISLLRELKQDSLLFRMNINHMQRKVNLNLNGLRRILIRMESCIGHGV